MALLDIGAATLDATVAARAMPGRVLTLLADVRDAAQVSAAVAAVEARFGRLDALVNNAGIAVFQPLRHTGFDAWREVLATNLDGPFLCTQAAVAAARWSTSPRSPAWARARGASPTAPAKRR